MSIQTPQPARGLVRFAIRFAALAVAAVMVAGCFCCTDSMWNLWALNDSDGDVLVHTTVAVPRTVRVPAHTYTLVDGGPGGVQAGSTIEIFDTTCEGLQTLTLGSGYDPLLYVAPDGRADVRHGSPWTNGLKSAQAAPTGSPTPSPCPGG